MPEKGFQGLRIFKHKLMVIYVVWEQEAVARTTTDRSRGLPLESCKV